SRLPDVYAAVALVVHELNQLRWRDFFHERLVAGCPLTCILRLARYHMRWLIQVKCLACLGGRQCRRLVLTRWLCRASLDTGYWLGGGGLPHSRPLHFDSPLFFVASVHDHARCRSRCYLPLNRLGIGRSSLSERRFFFRGREQRMAISVVREA